MNTLKTFDEVRDLTGDILLALIGAGEVDRELGQRTVDEIACELCKEKGIEHPSLEELWPPGEVGPLCVRVEGKEFDTATVEVTLTHGALTITDDRISASPVDDPEKVIVTEIKALFNVE